MDVRDFVDHLSTCLSEVDPKDLLSVISAINYAAKFIKAPLSPSQSAGVPASVLEQRNALIEKLKHDPRCIKREIAKAYAKVREELPDAEPEDEDDDADTAPMPEPTLEPVQRENDVQEPTQDAEADEENSQPRNQGNSQPKRRGVRQRSGPVQTISKRGTGTTWGRKKATQDEATKSGSGTQPRKSTRRRTLAAPKVLPHSQHTRTNRAKDPQPAQQQNKEPPSEEMTLRLAALKERGTAKDNLRNLDEFELAEADAAFLINHNTRRWETFTALPDVLKDFFDEQLINGVMAPRMSFELLKNRVHNEFKMDSSTTGVSQSAVVDLLPLFFEKLCSSDR